MRNIQYKGCLGPWLSRDVQRKRLQQVIQNELTDLQRETLTAYYYRQLTLEEIARERGVNKSTVCRTLKRAETRLRQYLKY